MVHLLSEITIKNYKSIIEETFDLSAFTPLVGYNNAGKSNLLEAVMWLLRRSSIPEESFYNKDEAVEISGKVTGISDAIIEKLSDKQQKAIAPYISEGAIELKRIQTEPGSSASKIKLWIHDRENNEWKKNPTGIDQAIQALFPEPIQIGAMEDSEEDVSKSKSSTTIGKLLAEIIGPIQEGYSSEVQNALDGIKDLLGAEGISRAEELNDFDKAVNEKVESFFPGVSIKVHVPTPELKEVFSKGTLKVFEDINPEGRDVSALGHGAQRSIQMALVQHLADIQRNTAQQASNTMLLIDEPDLYLHPQAIEVLREALKQLSGQGYQVIFSTHSPFMITAKDVENTILIRKNQTRGTYKRNSLRSAISSVAEAHPSQMGIVFSLSNSSNILFAERVILAEGKTENRLLPNIIQKITRKTIGLHKTALVPIEGSGSTKKTMEVLSAMDMPVKAIVDLDYALREGEKQGFLSEGDTDIVAIKAHLASVAPGYSINLNNGWPTKKDSAMTAAEAFALLAQESAIQSNITAVKDKMKVQGVYVWSKGTIENHLGNIQKNETSWANFNSRLETEDLETILPNDHEEITDLVTWLIS